MSKTREEAFEDLEEAWKELKAELVKIIGPLVEWLARKLETRN